ncbi:MAG: acetyl-CoA carboxylase biotin carboxyl carrier protein [Actinomycetota bacterium]
MQLDLNQLCELLTVLNSTSISELTLKSADFELTVRKPSPVSEPAVVALGESGLEERLNRSLSAIDPAILAAVASAGLASPATAPVGSGIEQVAKGAVPAGATATPPSGGPGATDAKWVSVPSPMVGTFYRAPGPDEPSFVEVGDRVRIGQTVCIIEAMKLMNELEAEVSGQVMEILVQNGEPVEYGQTLMRINPD